MDSSHPLLISKAILREIKDTTHYSVSLKQSSDKSSLLYLLYDTQFEFVIYTPNLSLLIHGYNEHRYFYPFLIKYFSLKELFIGPMSYNEINIWDTYSRIPDTVF